MRPVRLTFAGLRSYRTETVVDFSSLDLFAVIGDTGAGKSTLIEALCLALYARKSWSGGEAGLADMITDGVNTMRIELTFVADGHEYTVTRARHRNSSSPIDRLVSPTAPGADGARAVTERITQVIGLTYEQFTRAVVLPQGRFDSLLRAGERERNQILASILDLGDIVATRRQAEALHKEWSPQVVRWSTQREAFPADPAAAVVAAETDHRLTGERHQALVAAAAVVDAASQGAGRILEVRRNLSDALGAVQSVEPTVLADLARLHQTWVALDAESAEVTTELATIDVRIADVEQRTVDGLRGFESRDALVVAINEVRRVVDELPDALAAQQLAQQRVDVLAKEPPSGAVDPALAAAVAEAEAAVVVARRLADEAERSVTEGGRTWDAVAQALAVEQRSAEAVTAAEDALNAAMVVRDRAVDTVAEADAALGSARAAEHRALVADAAATAAAGCTEGDDCPVCARPLPVGFSPPTSSTDVGLARAEVVALESTLEQARAALAVAERSATTAEADVARRRQEAEAASGTVIDLRESSAGVDLTATSRELALATAVSARADASAAVDVATTAERAAVSAHAAGVASADAAVAAHRDQVAAAEESLVAADRDVARHRAGLDRLPPAWRLADATDVVHAAGLLLAALDAASTDLRALDADRQQAIAARHEAQGRSGAVERRMLADVQQPVAETQRAVTTHVRSVRRVDAVAAPAAATLDVTWESGGPFADAAPVSTAAELAAQQVALAATLSAAGATIDAAGALLGGLDARAAESEATIAAALHDVGLSSAAELGVQVGVAEQLHREAGRLLDLRRHEAAEAERLDEVLRVARPFVANVSVLAVALRDQHFLAHLVDAREQELLAEAARRLKDITKGRFGFVSDFGVVDVASGEVRSPDTLSGGERFQAALALALALVEIASRGGGRLDAVFVDEGFGSLDSNALDVALGTLGHVAKGGKMVALISHLRPVAEFVDTVLHVTKDDMFGSRIELLDADEREEMLADDVRSGLTA